MVRAADFIQKTMAVTKPTAMMNGLLAHCREAGIIDTDLYSDGRYGELLMLPGGDSSYPATHEPVDKRMHFAKMKGNEVFKVAVRMFGDCAERILKNNGFTAADLDLFVPHQANLRIIEAAVKAAEATLRGANDQLNNAANKKAALTPRIDLAKKRVEQFTALA